MIGTSNFQLRDILNPIFFRWEFVLAIMPMNIPPPDKPFEPTCKCNPRNKSKWRCKTVYQNVALMICDDCGNEWNKYSENDSMWGGPNKPFRGMY